MKGEVPMMAAPFGTGATILVVDDAVLFEYLEKITIELDDTVRALEDVRRQLCPK